MPLMLTVSVVPSLDVIVLSGLVLCPLAAMSATACESYAMAARASIAVLYADNRWVSYHPSGADAP